MSAVDVSWCAACGQRLDESRYGRLVALTLRYPYGRRPRTDTLRFCWKACVIQFALGGGLDDVTEQPC